ncbi:hypothetical protein L208DRAFT_1315591, partial [Tricholoma matsutake]
FVHASMPLMDVISHVPVQTLYKLACIHKIVLHSHVPKEQMLQAFENHNCINCNMYTFVFIGVLDDPAKRHRIAVAKSYGKETSEQRNHRNKTRRDRQENESNSAKEADNVDTTVFPPTPLTKQLSHAIITDWCNSSKPASLEEAGCAVCGELVPVMQLSHLKGIKGMLGILEAPGVTRVECSSLSQKVTEFKGPVLDYECNQICDSCRQSIQKGKVPQLASANNLWLGKVPKVLSQLNFVEKLLVACVRHNFLFVKVGSSGLRKMVANVIAFESPVPKIYNILPPPVGELDDVLAILFTGPSKPTEQDLSRTPLLVR